MEEKNNDNVEVLEEKKVNEEKPKKVEKKHKKSKDKKRIEELEKQVLELTEKVKYSQAELINYRKRKDEEMLNYKKYCHQDIILDLIGVVDNFERAISINPENLSDEMVKFLDGFKMMYENMCGILKNYGVSEISRKGEIFDSTLEQALMTDNVLGLKDDEVIEVLLKGYKLKDRVIRPASVKINKKIEGEINNE